MNEMDEISVNIDNENDINKIDVTHKDKIDVTHKDKIDKYNPPHNGKPITMIEVSPNEKYLVTYSNKDHSIVDWNVEDKDEGQLKLNDSEDDGWNNDDKDE